MMMEAISKAYQEENLIGSYCTAPLRAYNTCFQNKIQASESACKRTAWKICYVVSGVFAYLTLGILALVGIAINLCLIPPENGYSVWARLNGIPGDTEKFYKKIHEGLLWADADSKMRAKSSSEVLDSSSSNWYTYNLDKRVSFGIKNVFQDDPLPLIEASGPLEEPDNPSPQPQSCSKRMEPHIIPLIQKLSQKHGWCPEKYWIGTQNNKIIITIPLPDHIPMPWDKALI